MVLIYCFLYNNIIVIVMSLLGAPLSGHYVPGKKEKFQVTVLPWFFFVGAITIIGYEELKLSFGSCGVVWFEVGKGQFYFPFVISYHTTYSFELRERAGQIQAPCWVKNLKFNVTEVNRVTAVEFWGLWDSCLTLVVVALVYLSRSPSLSLVSVEPNYLRRNA